MTQKTTKLALALALLGAVLSFGVSSQMSVDISVPGVKIKKNGDMDSGAHSQAENTEGGIIGDVEMEGIMVLNNEVYIDGTKIPPHVKKYKSNKTGKNYIIERGKNGNISVREF